MKTYNSTFPYDYMLTPVNKQWDFYPFNEFSLNELCYFDIETTGLSAETSSIYLIGVGVYNKNEFEVVQWFADDYSSEKDILISFLDFVKDYKVVFQYNGNTFDIPFIRKKCYFHSLNCSIINDMKCVDLYVNLRRYSNMLGLPNKKLKSFEHYIGLDREDEYDGGQLIKVYADYIQAKYLHKDNEQLLKLLLLHNCEDITGLAQVASLMFLKEMNSLAIHAESINNSASIPAYTIDTVNNGPAGSRQTDFLTIRYSCSLPGDFSFTASSFSKEHEYVTTCSWSQHAIVLKIPVINDTLRYYFNDYKDYYYMLEENTVMHKSIAQYTDASVRRKAKKAECYLEKTSTFIPVSKPGCYSDELHIFRYDYTSKEYYIELTQDILNNTAWFEEYLHSQLS